LGTIGGGNHFAELQEVADVHDDAGLAALGLDRGQLALLVHSGSRGLGQSILTAHITDHAAEGLVTGSAEAEAYRARHDEAETWARVNRAVIAARFLEAIGADPPGAPAIDVCHNSARAADVDGCACWLHRKGAAPSDEGPIVIPGSRGALSYVVRPIGDGAGAGFSLAHGAGRKWRRSDARGRLRKRYKPRDLERTSVGGRVICEDRDLLYEEAPQAYKDVDVVVADLVGAGLLEIIATLRPLITYKTRRR
ncbi:MAG: RNA ligase RtcB family protein, partial [Myxococcales bacterium]|nr:RNA ligase RtcB family protein [Myxococcales bacterium]